MEYNTSRSQLIIPEYGRNVHQMVEYACTIEDKEERNKAANAIIVIMGQLNPHLRDVGDFAHKLWDHLFIISGFKLDVDSPFPKLEPEALEAKPEPLPYPSADFTYRHYGRTIEQLIKKGVEMEDGEMKTYFTESVANLMKRSYLSWNRDSVNDQVIFDHLSELSGGQLKLKEGFVLESTSDILAKVGPSNNNKKKKRGKNNSRKKKHN